MKISYESLAELRGKLPKGSSLKIRDRLKDKNIVFSPQYIRRCLDPDKPDYNTIIIDEAIALGEEITREIEDREERVSGIRNAGL